METNRGAIVEYFTLFSQIFVKFNNLVIEGKLKTTNVVFFNILQKNITTLYLTFTTRLNDFMSS